jgi:orotate phosphoribosyltransferase
MIYDLEIAQRTAHELLQIKAIKLQPKQPFTWASGWKSPIYCDNRISLSYPNTRNFLKKQLAQLITAQFENVEVIAGVATGAIAIGALVAEELGLPFVYVRPEPKKHGRQNQVEGQLDPKAKVLVLEDLISTGGSSLKVVEVLRNAGAQVIGMAALFNYGFDIAEENFAQANCLLYSLSDFSNLLEGLLQSGELESETVKTLEQWRKNPSSWQAT